MKRGVKDSEMSKRVKKKLVSLFFRVEHLDYSIIVLEPHANPYH